MLMSWNMLNKLTILTLLLFIFIFFLFVYPNSLFYTVVLLFLSSVVLFNLVSLSILSVLLMLLILIVYAGAIMILIGYVCAVCPNLRFNPNISYSLYSFFLPLLVISAVLRVSIPSFSSIPSLFPFFYSSFGGVLFSVIVLMLFVTLLIVTSQYLAPKGPFRSTNL